MVVLDLCSEAEDAIWSPYSSTALACISSVGKVSIYDLAIRLHKPLCCQRIAPQRRAQPTKITFGCQQPVLLVGDDKWVPFCPASASSNLCDDLVLQLECLQQNVDLLLMNISITCSRNVEWICILL